MQNYLNSFLSQRKITEEQKTEMRSKFAHIGKAHGLPKVHKQLDRIPVFWPIVDITNTMESTIFGKIT